MLCGNPPGTGSVAIAQASLGSMIVVMGKLGDCGYDYGYAILYYLNLNNVQTHSIRMDRKPPMITARSLFSADGLFLPFYRD
ncbi:hypothetical protein MLD38_008231 [Melastoma candidum]|uniref:Uncharacterized protein n=1 Tax=Melastoma candidum TaxID=119954 RepID=A0ACB9RTA9_9MYRT|nr:hypothetical protein MLD38_008231 [Melastoma candidum]